MADKTHIEWTRGSDGLFGATWNPVVGCSKCSRGCKFCYAMREAHRLAGNPNEKIRAAFAGLTHTVGGRPQWTGVVRLLPERLDQPLRWRKPRIIFVNSLSDLFHESLTDEEIARVFAVMVLAPRHIFQVLTKRAGRMRDLLSTASFWLKVRGFINLRVYADRDRFPEVAISGLPARSRSPWIWLGTSVEDQRAADERIPALLATPADVRFLSCEPLVGPVDLAPFDLDGRPASGDQFWVIAGGESGPEAQPMHPEWARSLRDQCQERRIPFFFKQWGSWKPISETPESEYSAFYTPRRVAKDHEFQPTLNEIYGLRCTVETRAIQYDGGEGYHSVAGFPGYLTFRLGKKKAGRLLDGRAWDEMPEARRG